VIVLDTHVHVYPGYERAAVFFAAERNIRGAAPSASSGYLFLTEREDCNFWDELAGGLSLPANWSRVRTLDDRMIEYLNRESGFSLFWIRGHQVVSSEGLEILALATNRRYKDRVSPLDELAQLIYQDDGLVVIPWSVGKWTGKRRRVLKKFLSGEQRENILLGDVAQRAFAQPLDRSLGFPRGSFRILFGSDPLPLACEESVIGNSLTLLSDRFSQPSSLYSLLAMLRAASPSDLSFLGTRNSCMGACLRWLKLFIEKQARQLWRVKGKGDIQ
jgi:hypothetical protein